MYIDYGVSTIVNYREDLINTEIERAVSNMQSVIDLGRLVRERNTLPIKVGSFHSLSTLFLSSLTLLYSCYLHSLFTVPLYFVYVFTLSLPISSHALYFVSSQSYYLIPLHYHYIILQLLPYLFTLGILSHYSFTA